MTMFEATVPTEHASRYLQQLCKHWSHKFEVSFDPTHGTVRLPAGDCGFVADPAHLHLTLRGEDAAELPRLCDVVTNHLTRFAFREELVVQWRQTEASDAATEPA